MFLKISLFKIEKKNDVYHLSNTLDRKQEGGTSDAVRTILISKYSRYIKVSVLQAYNLLHESEFVKRSHEFFKGRMY